MLTSKTNSLITFRLIVKKLIFFAMFFVLLITQALYSQCSDAGICTIGRHQPGESGQRNNHIYLGFSLGSSGKDADINSNLNDLSYSQFRLEGDFDLKNNFRVNLSIPFLFISGPLGESTGQGDAEIVFSKTFTVKKKHKLAFFLGGKLATGKINTKDSLPQRYMPGLGTHDIIAGAQYSVTNYFFGIGYQKPFGRSENYLTRLKRGDDVFFRAGFMETFNKVNVKAEILTIIRLQPSSVLTSFNPETFTEIKNSNEPQVNLAATVGYRLSDEFNIAVQAAIPFLKRDYNFDGLKRAFSVGVNLGYGF